MISIPILSATVAVIFIIALIDEVLQWCERHREPPEYWPKRGYPGDGS